MAYIVSCLLFPSLETQSPTTRVARPSKILEQSSCQGWIWMDPAAKGCRGFLRGPEGIWNLVDITIPKLQGASESLTFVQRLEGRGEREAIRATFRNMRGDLWLGQYKGLYNGKPVSGDARCNLTEIPDEFFDPAAEFQRDSRPNDLRSATP